MLTVVGRYVEIHCCSYHGGLLLHLLLRSVKLALWLLHLHYTWVLFAL